MISCSPPLAHGHVVGDGLRFERRGHVGKIEGDEEAAGVRLVGLPTGSSIVKYAFKGGEACGI